MRDFFLCHLKGILTIFVSPPSSKPESFGNIFNSPHLPLPPLLNPNVDPVISWKRGISQSFFKLSGLREEKSPHGSRRLHGGFWKQLLAGCGELILKLRQQPAELSRSCGEGIYFGNVEHRPCSGARPVLGEWEGIFGAGLVLWIWGVWAERERKGSGFFWSFLEEGMCQWKWETEVWMSGKGRRLGMPQK